MVVEFPVPLSTMFWMLPATLSALSVSAMER